MEDLIDLLTYECPFTGAKRIAGCENGQLYSKCLGCSGFQLSTGIASTSLQYFQLHSQTFVQTNNLGKWSWKKPEKFKIFQEKLNPTWTISLGVQLLWKQLPVQRPSQAVLHRMWPPLQLLRAKCCKLESIAWYIRSQFVIKRLNW